MRRPKSDSTNAEIILAPSTSVNTHFMHRIGVGRVELKLLPNFKSLFNIVDSHSFPRLSSAWKCHPDVKAGSCVCQCKFACLTIVVGKIISQPFCTQSKQAVCLAGAQQDSSF